MPRVLINKKTGKEFQTSDPEAVLKKYPKTFRVKPATTLNSEVLKKDEAIKNHEVKDAEVVAPKKKTTKKQDQTKD